MQKRKFDLPDMYLELAEGTAEWYMGTHFFEEACDLYDAEEIVKQGKNLLGIRFTLFIIRMEVYINHLKEEKMFITNDQCGIKTVSEYFPLTFQRAGLIFTRTVRGMRLKF